MICIVESTIESMQNKTQKYRHVLHIIYITTISNLVIILIKYIKLITTYYMLYDTCDYHILHYSKLIIVHPITTVLIVNLTSKRMNNSCALL